VKRRIRVNESRYRYPSKRVRVATAMLLLVMICCCAVWTINAPAVFILRSAPLTLDARIQVDGRSPTIGEFGFNNEIMYFTDTPWPGVVALYESRMKKLGWQSGGSVVRDSKVATVQCLMFTRFRVFSVTIRIAGYPSGSTTVIIKTGYLGIPSCSEY
jgi:hypothetical protein